jgi:hypothetical protein
VIRSPQLTGFQAKFREACVRCPLLRVDPAQKPRLEEIHVNLIDRLAEAKQQGWFGEVAANIIYSYFALLEQRYAGEIVRRYGVAVESPIDPFNRATSGRGFRHRSERA